MSEQEKRPFYLKNESMKAKFEDYQRKLRDFKRSGAAQNQDDEELIDDEMRQQMRRNLIQLPTSRVRQVCALDDQFKLISKEALLLITKATELFVTDLAGTAGKVAKQQSNRKTIML